MDFPGLTAEDEGTWVQLEMQGQKMFWDGEKYTFEETDYPCRVLLRDVAANEVQDTFQKHSRAELAYQERLKRAKGDEIDNEVEKYANKAEAIMDALIIAASKDWENIYKDGKPLAFSAKAMADMIDRSHNPQTRMVRRFLFDAIVSARANLTNAA